MKICHQCETLWCQNSPMYINIVENMLYKDMTFKRTERSHIAAWQESAVIVVWQEKYTNTCNSKNLMWASKFVTPCVKQLWVIVRAFNACLKFIFHMHISCSNAAWQEFVISPGKFIFELCEAQNLSLRMSVGPGKNKQTSVTIINGCQLFRWQFQMSSWCNFGWNVTIIKLSYIIKYY